MTATTHHAVELVRQLRVWCEEYADQVRSCYLVSEPGYSRVFVLTTSRQFDFAFAEEVAAVELRLARSGYRLWVSQLPLTHGPSPFFRPEQAVQVFPLVKQEHAL